MLNINPYDVILGNTNNIVNNNENIIILFHDIINFWHERNTILKFRKQYLMLFMKCF